jgi:hypothetical protein
MNMHRERRNLAVIGYVFGYSYTLTADEASSVIDFADPDRSMASLTKESRHLDIREPVYRSAHDDLSRLPVPWALYWTTNVSFQRGSLTKSGMFDEIFENWGAEDIEFAYRLFESGCAFALSREAAGLHYPHERKNDFDFVTNGLNKLLLYKMHPFVATELFAVGSALRLNEEYRDFLACHAKRSHSELFSSTLSDKAVRRLSGLFVGSKNVLIGSEDGFLLEPCGCRVGVEYNTDWNSIAEKNNPDAEIRECLGVRTLMDDNVFDCGIITYSEERLSPSIIRKIIQEARRISKSVYMIGKREMKPPEDIQLKQSFELDDEYCLNEL